MVVWFMLMLLVHISKAACPSGMFSISPTSKCFKYINEGMSWSSAMARCASDGLKLARPSDVIAVDLRLYLWDNYGCCRAWVAARGDGKQVAWVDDGSAMRSDLFRTADTLRVDNSFCLQMNVVVVSSLVYTVASCSSTAPVLCEGSAAPAPVSIEVSRIGATTKPSLEFKNLDKEKCGLSTSYDIRTTSRDQNLTDKIVGGQETLAGKYPWMVHMQYYIRTRADHSRFGGSLISRRWVLTAAHCVKYLEKNIPVYIKIGYVNLKQQQPQSKLLEVYLKDFILHAEYDASTWQNDIALVRLPQNVNFNTAIRPICLADNQMIPFEDKAVAAGWGLLNPGDTEIPDTLREVQLDVWAENECANQQLFICTSAVAGKDTCKGDSGGPLMVQKGHQWFIIGIVSHGPIHCGASILPGVYTRVPNYFPFITGTVSF